MKLLRTLTLFLVLGFVAVTGAYDYLATVADTAMLEDAMATSLGLVARELTLTLPTVERLAGEAEVARVIEAQNHQGTPKVRFVGETEVQTLTPESGEWREIRDGRMRLYRHLGARTLEFSSSMTRIDAKRRQNLIRAVVKSTLLVLLGSVFAWLVGLRLVGRPVERLIAHARRIAGGDLGRQGHHGQGELGQLGDEMNAMCERLAEAQARVERETEARVRALTELRHADRLKTLGQLAAGVAHELGTPLNVVAGHAQMMAKLVADGPIADTAELGRDARTIGEQAARMTVIIRQLLDFARSSPLHTERVELGALCQRTLDLLRHLPRSPSVSLELEAPSPVWALADPAQLQQALTNLVINAVQASPDGGVVRVALSSDGKDARLEVVDHGSGIAPTDRDRVFEPFFTTKPVGEGTGLGLSVAYGIVEDHGGHIALSSEVGRGTTATIVLPKIEDHG